MKTLAQWLSKIEAGHPIDIDMGLERVSKAASHLGIDFDDAVVITVAGTNGKGTTCRLIEQICLQAGFNVGVYSSPHILRFNERIRLNDVDATDADICAAFEAIESSKAELSLTYFEYATLAAMWLFQKIKLNIIILEVGLGGRLDATNIIDADINVLTSIAMDHQRYLGNTLNEIAREKAGIIKPQKLTVIGFEQRYSDAEKWLSQQHNSVLRRGVDFTLDSADDGYQGDITFAGKVTRYRWSSSAIPSPNIMTALASAYWLTMCLPSRQAAMLKATLGDVNAVSRLIENTALAGRAQLVRRSPKILIDVAHNPASADYLRTIIGTFSFDSCHIVVGMLKDKNIEQTLLSLSSISAHWYCATLPTQRGESSERLVKAVPSENAISVLGFESIESALSSAVERAAKTDMIVVLGSFVTVAQAMNFLTTHPLD